MTQISSSPARIDHRIEWMPVTAVSPHPKNPRIHSDKKVRKVAASIREHGFVSPIIANAKGQIIAGHCRLRAAVSLGYDTVPVITISHLNNAQELALIIADNKLVEEGKWDNEAITIIFEELQSLDYPVELSGFDTCEIDLLFDEKQATPEKAPPVLPPDYKPVTQVGDVWLLGNHRLVCGNSLNRETYDALLGNEKVQMVFTDAPYNVRINGHVKR